MVINFEGMTTAHLGNETVDLTDEDREYLAAAYCRYEEAGHGDMALCWALQAWATHRRGQAPTVVPMPSSVMVRVNPTS